MTPTPPPPVEVGRGLLYPALRKAGVTLGPGRTPSPAQYEDAIEELNRLSGSLNCDRLFIYSLDILRFPLTGKSSYTIGNDPAADWQTPRPPMISEAYWVTGDCQKDPLELLTPQTWQGCGDCGTLSGIYNDRAHPVSTIYLNGSAGSGEIELFSWHTVPKFGATTDLVVMPDGLEDVLVLQLALRLGPQFGRPVDQNTREDARLSMMRWLSINAPKPILELPGWLSGCGCDGWSGGGGSGGGGLAGPPGPAGPVGPPGPAANLVWGETPTGTVDGANQTFFLAHTPLAGITLFVNGVEQRPSLDYTLSGSQITFSVSPKTGETIVANYNY